MPIILPIVIGFSPSFIWLLFFLRKDIHPESNKMILKMFGMGMIITVFAAFLQLGINEMTEIGISFFWEGSVIMSYASFAFYNLIIIALILASAFVEEFFKYVVVKEGVLGNSEFDEPTDAMLYMIIVGLGFAAVENILILFSMEELFSEITAYVLALRFVGATFLHALCSALVGYFLALSVFETKRKMFLITWGIVLASLLHALFNFSIIKASEQINFLIIPVILLSCLAIFISFAFKKLKRKVGLCKIDY